MVISVAFYYDLHFRLNHSISGEQLRLQNYSRARNVPSRGGARTGAKFVNLFKGAGAGHIVRARALMEPEPPISA